MPESPLLNFSTYLLLIPILQVKYKCPSKLLWSYPRKTRFAGEEKLRRSLEKSKKRLAFLLFWCYFFENSNTGCPMRKLVRFGISLDAQLLQEFDALIREKEYTNRSEAIRDLIRDELIHKEWQDEKREIIGTITLIYDHHIRDLSTKLTHDQHQHHHQIISTMHVHLDHDNCLEVLAVRGKANEVRKIADHLVGMKGVKHGKLVTTSTGENLR